MVEVVNIVFEREAGRRGLLVGLGCGGGREVIWRELTDGADLGGSAGDECDQAEDEGVEFHVWWQCLLDEKQKPVGDCLNVTIDEWETQRTGLR